MPERDREYLVHCDRSGDLVFESPWTAAGGERELPYFLPGKVEFSAMDTHAIAVPDSVRSDRCESTAFLILGGDLPMPPGLPGVCFRLTPSIGCAGIIILGPTAPAKLAEALDEMPEPALPIADFADNRELRRDFIGERFDPSSIQAFRDHSTPIWRRLSELPVRAAREDRAELNILRLAYSRDVSIEASFAPDSMLLVDYQLLGRGSATRQRLEALADMDLLRRRFFTRSYACRHCGSARLHAYEACSACGSGDLFDEAIVHHYRCGWQGPESGFADHRLLVCPKCRRELRHFGVDYGKPGIVVRCRECGAAGDEPVAKFVCLDCAAITPTADCVPTDWSHYDLTEEGIRALRDGRLPRLSITPVLEGHLRAFSLNEFRLLTAEGMRVSARYGRPFAVGRLSVSNIGALRREIGPVAVNAAFRLAIEVSVGSLRESDFVAADGAESMVIGFPETSARDASNVLARVKKKVAAVIAAPLELVVSAVDGDAAATLVDQD